MGYYFKVLKKPAKQAENKPARNAKGQLLPGNTANPNGRPTGSTMKEYVADKFRRMSNDEKEKWLKETGIDPGLAWRMAEGNPSTHTDLTSGGEQITLAEKSDAELATIAHISDGSDG